MPGRKLPPGTKCYICGKEAKRRERNKDGGETGKYVCIEHYKKEYYQNILKNDPNSQANIMKSLRNYRTGNQDPKHESTKGEQDVDMICELYGYKNLNRKYNNLATPLDCLDEETGLYYQVQGRRYSSIYKCWTFTNFENTKNIELPMMKN